MLIHSIDISLFCDHLRGENPHPSELSSRKLGGIA